MSDKKISQLTSGTTLVGTEPIPMVQGGQTVATTPNAISALIKPYKVYTALLTQSGGDNWSYISSDDIQPLVIGVTYKITANNGGDFTNVGSPNNDVNTFFIATGTTPNSWGAVGDTEVSYNTGAPIATVLENTIGSIWFTINQDGVYGINSTALFTENKTCSFISSSLFPDEGFCYIDNISTSDTILLSTIDNTYTYSNDKLNNTPIEIRVYL